MARCKSSASAAHPFFTPTSGVECNSLRPTPRPSSMTRLPAVAKSASPLGTVAPVGKGDAPAVVSRIDQNSLTAAHATLPIGTRVRVTLVGSGRNVVVTINDRPGTRERIIDLSRAAARELGILGRGVAMVTLSPP